VKENLMTATTAERELGAEELLLAEVMRGREDEGKSMIEHPLLLAALMRRRSERQEGGGMMENPLLMAALMHRRAEREDGGIMENPLLLAALMRR
jgi:uridine kinase